MRAALVLIAIIFAPAVRAQDEAALPDGKGKADIQKVCTTCHDLHIVVKSHAGRATWTEIVNEMKTRGADGTDEQFKTILNYLSRYFGPLVNINTAGLRELSSELDLPTAEASAIVEYRSANGAFANWSDLAKVPKLDVAKLEPLKGRIIFQEDSQ